MKVAIAIDSFKGSLSSIEAGAAAAAGVKRVFPDAVCEVRPLADGGEGTVDALDEMSDVGRIPDRICSHASGVSESLGRFSRELKTFLGQWLLWFEKLRMFCPGVFRDKRVVGMALETGGQIMI